MATVFIQPLPLEWHSIPPLYWPGVPPIFPDGEPPTPADRVLARSLFVLLDPVSQSWYRRNSSSGLFAGL